MAVLDDFKLEAEKAIQEAADAFAAKLAEKDAVIEDQKKQAEATAASVLSSDDLAWLADFLTRLKGMRPV